jgi:predicted lipoprotein with Yx(FWY)xxD motif
MNRALKAFIAAPVTAAIAVLATGCGGSAYSPGAYGSPAKTSALSTVGVAGVGVANTKLGRIVVDSTGRTLYLFERDKNRRSACNGACAQEWPPLLSHGKPVARARAHVTRSQLGTSRRTDGSEQVTYAGHPLYRFTADTKPGQMNGEGLEEFGGGWDVLSPAGTKIEADG